MTVRADATGLAGDPLEEIGIVRALVEQDAAAFPGPRGPPAAGRVISGGAKPVGDGPADAAQLAELPFLDKVAQAAVARGGSLVEHRGEDLPFAAAMGG